MRPLGESANGFVASITTLSQSCDCNVGISSSTVEYGIARKITSHSTTASIIDLAFALSPAALINEDNFSGERDPKHTECPALSHSRSTAWPIFPAPMTAIE